MFYKRPIQKGLTISVALLIKDHITGSDPAKFFLGNRWLEDCLDVSVESLKHPAGPSLSE